MHNMKLFTTMVGLSIILAYTAADEKESIS